MQKVHGAEQIAAERDKENNVVSDITVGNVCKQQWNGFVWLLPVFRWQSVVSPNVDKLKHRTSDEWDKIDQQVLDSAIKQWHKHLAACVSARGGHVEHSHALKQKSKLINSLQQ